MPYLPLLQLSLKEKLPFFCFIQNCVIPYYLIVFVLENRVNNGKEEEMKISLMEIVKIAKLRAIDIIQML